MYKSGLYISNTKDLKLSSMILDYSCALFVTMIIVIRSSYVNLQIPMQVYQMPPQLFALPPPQPAPIAVPMPVPIPPPMAFQISLPIQMPVEEPKTTTTTTTERAMGIAVPVPFPYPVQFAIPAYPPPPFCKKKPRPNNCPVCPPCLCNPCTPAFFSYCSPCHQKCRCRDRRDAPLPLPHSPPMAVAGPAFPVPIPALPGRVPVPFHRPRPRTDFTFEIEDESRSCSSEIFPNKRRRKRIGFGVRKPFYRRYMDSNVEISNGDLVKPVLSYISNDGDVKLEKALSNDEAAELLQENKVYQKVFVTTGDDPEQGPRLTVVSNVEKKSEDVSNNHRRRQVVLSSGSAQHMLGEGKKEVVFKPPFDKKISNLSVSFQIT